MLSEDNVSGKISDERFAKMSVKYEAELNKDESKAVTSDMFLSSVRKYTRAKKLTPRMLNELTEKIEVY